MRFMVQGDITMALTVTIMVSFNPAMEKTHPLTFSFTTGIGLRRGIVVDISFDDGRNSVIRPLLASYSPSS